MNFKSIALALVVFSTSLVNFSAQKAEAAGCKSLDGLPGIGTSEAFYIPEGQNKSTYSPLRIICKNEYFDFDISRKKLQADWLAIPAATRPVSRRIDCFAAKYSANRLVKLSPGTCKVS